MKPNWNWKLFYFTIILVIAALPYAFIKVSPLKNSGLVYIGIPLILALAISIMPSKKTAVSSTMRVMTIALILSAWVFKEGYLCIIFASPIFYLIGWLFATQVDAVRKRRASKLQAGVIATLIAVLSLEGTTEMTTFPRETTVVASDIVSGNIEDVRAQLSKTPHFTNDKPLFLKIFPYPAEISGSGLNVGDIRQAKFVAYKQIWWKRVEGTLAFAVTESTDNHIKFKITKDDSYVSHYLKWLSSEVSLEKIDETHTKVTWKHEYERKLDPSWYFGPLQYYAVKLTTEQLIKYVATPKVNS